MKENLGALLDCFTLMGLSHSACMEGLEANGVPILDAFEVLLNRFPPTAKTPDLVRTRLAAGFAQDRPDRYEALAKVLERSGIHPLSMLNWDGWERDQALDLLQRHWCGPGRPPLCLVGIGHVACADLRVLPHGLRLQRLRLAHAPNFRNLPIDLEVEETLYLKDLTLTQIPSGIPGGGQLLMDDVSKQRRFLGGGWLWPWRTKLQTFNVAK